MGGGWPSQRRLQLLLVLCIALPVATLGVCYGLWVAHGCIAFLPFISDLGLHGRMELPFIAGFVLTSVAMCTALPHIVVARHHLIFSLRLSKNWRMLNAVVALAGGAASLGVGMIGFVPWDRVLLAHMTCASAIFSGGTTWALGSYLLARQFAHADECKALGAYPRTTKFQLMVVVACGCDWLYAFICFCGASLSSPDMINLHSLPSILKLARDNFDAYCTGEQGWHSLVWVHWDAVSEWILVALMIVSIVASLADVEAHGVFQRCMAGQPFLRSDAEESLVLPQISG